MVRYIALWDVGQIQYWLEDYAARGWYLKKIRLGSFAVFRRGEPKRVRYRLEPSLEDGREELEQRIDSYAAFGWQYIGKYQDTYHIFAAEDPAATELHTESATMEMVLEKQARRKGGWAIGLSVLYGLNFALRVFGYGGTGVAYALTRLNWGDFISAMVWLVMIPLIMQPWLAVRRQLKRLRNTGYLPENVRAVRRDYLLGSLRMVTVAVMLAAVVVMMFHLKDYIDADYMWGEDAAQLVYMDAAALGGSEQEEPVFAAIRRGPFVRLYNYVSAAGVKENWDIITDYYDLRGQWFAERVVDYELEKWTATPLEDDRFDELYVAERDAYEKLWQRQVVGRVGEKVIAVQVGPDLPEQLPDLTACLDEIYALIQ